MQQTMPECPVEVVVLLLWVAPEFRHVSDLATGWIALTGIVFILHFGVFHAAALFWRRRGRNVKPIMNAPILATSVTEFWSRRWNLAFRDYASLFLFIPLARFITPTIAVLAGYVFSGLIHELAISVPAQAGYGLPTLYFFIQGLAILIERAIGHTTRRRHTSHLFGRLWTVVVTVPGACLLFHPPFLRSIVLPFVDNVTRLI